MAINTSGITTPIATFAPGESPESDGIGDVEGEDVGVFVFVGVVVLMGVCVRVSVGEVVGDPVILEAADSTALSLACHQIGTPSPNTNEAL
jgi:hypothetical protein